MANVIPGLIVAVTLIFTALTYENLPERIVTHWGMDGQPDGFSSRVMGAWLMPLIMFAVWALMRFLPKIDPRADNYLRFRSTYATIIAVIIAFMAVMQVAILGYALGWDISVPRIIPFCVGAMLIVIGNLLPRARPNWFVGIRTPWTLSDDRVWEKTHRLGGVLFMVGGFVLAASAFGPPELLTPAMVTTIVLAAGVPFLYSFYAYRKTRQQ